MACRGAASDRGADRSRFRAGVVESMKPPRLAQVCSRRLARRSSGPKARPRRTMTRPLSKAPTRRTPRNASTIRRTLFSQSQKRKTVTAVCRAVFSVLELLGSFHHLLLSCRARWQAPLQHQLHRLVDRNAHHPAVLVRPAVALEQDTL